MTIRRRITLLFMATVVVLLAVFAVVFVLQADYARREFWQRLRERAEVVGYIYLKKDELQAIKLGKGYRIEWAGEFENQVRATKRLGQVVPVSLVIIFILLFITFGNGKDAALVLANVPFALIGGIAALHITGVNFSISAGIGFIALLGICIQNGIVLITVFKQNLRKRMSLSDSLKDGVASRVRPVVMTALMAMIGLLSAALSTGIGSETQKPLAIVVIGGLVTATVLTLLIFPLIFAFFYREMHQDGPSPKPVEEERPVLVGA